MWLKGRLSFNLKGFTNIFAFTVTVPPFMGSKWTGQQTEQCFNILKSCWFLNSWSKLCISFPPSRCSKSLLQPRSVAVGFLKFFLHRVLYLITEKHSLLGFLCLEKLCFCYTFWIIIHLQVLSCQFLSICLSLNVRSSREQLYMLIILPSPCLIDNGGMLWIISSSFVSVVP